MVKKRTNPQFLVSLRLLSIPEATHPISFFRIPNIINYFKYVLVWEPVFLFLANCKFRFYKSPSLCTCWGLISKICITSLVVCARKSIHLICFIRDIVKFWLGPSLNFLGHSPSPIPYLSLIFQAHFHLIYNFLHELWMKQSAAIQFLSPKFF